MGLVCQKVNKETLPKIVREHDNYLIRNAPRFYPLLDDMLSRLREQWSVADIQRALDAKNPGFLKPNVTSVLNGKQIDYDAKPDWTSTNTTGLSDAGSVTKAEGDLSSTPAPPEDRRTGSRNNPEGSAASERGGIVVDATTEKTLRNKLNEHNEKHTTKWQRATMGQLKAVYRRGAGAFSTSHRPGMTRAQWAFARVNSFLDLLSSGKPKNPRYITDNDLLHEDHPASSKVKKQTTYRPPVSVARNARNALEVRRRMPPSRRGMTEVGLARARDLMNRRPVSVETLRRMKAYFDRHEVDKKGSTWNAKGKGWQAWNGWGGDEGRQWVEGILGNLSTEKILKQLLDYDANEEVIINLYTQMATAAGRREYGAIGVTTSFALQNPDAIAAIKTRTGNLITDVDATTRRSVVEMVEQSLLRNYVDGPNSRTLAREIKAGIGMHPTHAKWWANHRQRLIDEGLTGRNLEVASKKYQEKLIRYRSKMIARTETSFAISRGQTASWAQATQEGFLDADQKKEWVALLDNRTSDICMELHGQQIPVGEDFVFNAGNGGAVTSSPAHPFCRSVVTLVRSTEGFR